MMKIEANHITAALCAVLLSSVMMLSVIAPAQANDTARSSTPATKVATPSAYLA